MSTTWRARTSKEESATSTKAGWSGSFPECRQHSSTSAWTRLPSCTSATSSQTPASPASPRRWTSRPARSKAIRWTRKTFPSPRKRRWPRPPNSHPNPRPRRPRWRPLPSLPRRPLLLAKPMRALQHPRSPPQLSRPPLPSPQRRRRARSPPSPPRSSISIPRRPSRRKRRTTKGTTRNWTRPTPPMRPPKRRSPPSRRQSRPRQRLPPARHLRRKARRSRRRPKRRPPRLPRAEFPASSAPRREKGGGAGVGEGAGGSAGEGGGDGRAGEGSAGPPPPFCCFLPKAERRNEGKPWLAGQERRGGNGEKRPGNGHKRAQIQDLLKEGDEVLVQAVKDPIGTKGARITCHISLPGRHLVFMPTVDHVGISRRIENEKERRRLRELVARYRPPGTGFIVRTVAENEPSEKLTADIKFLLGLWNEVGKKRESMKPPACVHPDLDLILRSIRDLFSDDVEKLVIDDRSEFDRVRAFVEQAAPELKERIEL